MSRTLRLWVLFAAAGGFGTVGACGSGGGGGSGGGTGAVAGGTLYVKEDVGMSFATLRYGNVLTLDGEAVPAGVIAGAATNQEAVAGGAIFVDSTTNTLYVGSGLGGNGRVLAFAPASTRSGNTAPDRTVPGFGSVSGLLVDSTDRLMVSDAEVGVVLVFAGASTLSGTSTPTISLGGLQTPQGLALDEATDTLYVADEGLAAIAVFNGTSASTSTPSRTITSSLINNPRAVEYVAALDRLYVADPDGPRIMAFDAAASGSVDPLFTVLGSSSFPLSGFIDIKRNPADGSMWVSVNNAVHVYEGVDNLPTSGGFNQLSPTRRITDPSGSDNLDAPTAISIDFTR